MKGQGRLFLVLWSCLSLVAVMSGCARNPGVAERAIEAPDFSLPNLDGDILNLRDFRGKPLMLVFWRVNCPSCEYQMPFLQRFYEKWSYDEIALVTVNVGEPPDMVAEYVSRHGLTFPVLVDTRQQVAQTYGIVGVPFTFFIDADGTIKAYKIGPFQGTEAIEAAVKKVFPDIRLEM